MRRFLVPILLLAITGCTPGQIEAWSDWYRADPNAAVAFAEQPEIQAQLGGGSDEPDVDSGGDSGGVYEPWISLAECESGGNWHIDTGNGYYGGLQFAWGSWEAAGGSGNPAHASPSEQVARAETLQDMQGWGAWPSCARQIGLL